MAKSKNIPLDVMFANDKGDVFDFTNVTIRDKYNLDSCYSNSRVEWMLSEIFNKGNPLLMLKKIARPNPRHKDNIYESYEQLRKLDQEIAELEEKLAKKKLLCANIIDESKHIKHVNLRGKAKDWLIFN